MVAEFIRLLGMLTIVAERDDVPMGMEGQLGCQPHGGQRPCVPAGVYKLSLNV